MHITLTDPRPIADALSETSSAAPHWGIHTADVEPPSGDGLSGVGRLRRAARRRRVNDLCATFLWRGVLGGFLLGAAFGGLLAGLLA